MYLFQKKSFQDILLSRGKDLPGMWDILFHSGTVPFNVPSNFLESMCVWNSLCNISQGLASCVQCRVGVKSTLQHLKLTMLYFARIAVLKNWTESTGGFIIIIFMQLHFLEACSLAVCIFYRKNVAIQYAQKSNPRIGLLQRISQKVSTS